MEGSYPEQHLLFHLYFISFIYLYVILYFIYPLILVFYSHHYVYVLFPFYYDLTWVISVGVRGCPCVPEVDARLQIPPQKLNLGVTGTESISRLAKKG